MGHGAVPENISLNCANRGARHPVPVRWLLVLHPNQPDRHPSHGRLPSTGQHRRSRPRIKRRRNPERHLRPARRMATHTPDERRPTRHRQHHQRTTSVRRRRTTNVALLSGWSVLSFGFILLHCPGGRANKFGVVPQLRVIRAQNLAGFLRHGRKDRSHFPNAIE